MKSGNKQLDIQSPAPEDFEFDDDDWNWRRVAGLQEKVSTVTMDHKAFAVKTNVMAAATTWITVAKQKEIDSE